MQSVQGTHQAVARDVAKGTAPSDILARWSSQAGLRSRHSGPASPAFLVSMHGLPCKDRRWRDVSGQQHPVSVAVLHAAPLKPGSQWSTGSGLASPCVPGEAAGLWSREEMRLQHLRELLHACVIG